MHLSRIKIGRRIKQPCYKTTFSPGFHSTGSFFFMLWAARLEKKNSQKSVFCFCKAQHRMWKHDVNDLHLAVSWCFILKGPSAGTSPG